MESNILFVAFHSIFNVISAVGIVIVLKYVPQEYPVFTYAIHQLFSTIYTQIVIRTQDKPSSIEDTEVKPEPSQKEQIIAALTHTISIPVSVIVIYYNSFTNNQLYKIMTIPAVAVASHFIFHSRLTLKSFVFLVLIIISSIGAIIGSSKLDYDFMGVLVGIISISLASIQQVYFQYLGKKYNLNGFDLLYYGSPYCFLFSLIFFEIQLIYTGKTAMFFIFYENVINFHGLILTGMLSIFLNITAFSLLGGVSALYFQLLGLMKLYLFIFADIFLGKIPFSAMKMFYVLVCLNSMIGYGYTKGQLNGRASITCVLINTTTILILSLVLLNK